MINEGWTKWLSGHLKDLKGEEKAQRIAAMSIIHENPWNKDEMWVAAGGLQGGQRRVQPELYAALVLSLYRLLYAAYATWCIF